MDVHTYVCDIHLRVNAAIGTKRVDGVPLKTISEIVAASERPLSIRFRDPSRFVMNLDVHISYVSMYECMYVCMYLRVRCLTLTNINAECKMYVCMYVCLIYTVRMYA